MVYASSRSSHFSIQNMSVSTYLDITYPQLLWIYLWAQTPQRTPANTYVRPPSRCLSLQLTSVNNVPAVGTILMPSVCPRCQEDGGNDHASNCCWCWPDPPTQAVQQLPLHCLIWTTVFVVTRSCVQFVGIRDRLIHWHFSFPVGYNIPHL